jgi:hypothetical protein|tara:strand:+ start:2162 stop:3103 length:942 start_codon:yes stop_codon:yes gene_type:complete
MAITYTPEGRPTQLLRDLLLSYWDVRSGNEIPVPQITEVPLPDFQRIDVRNQGDIILVSLEGFEEELIHIGFKNRQITATMQMQFNVFTSRQRLYDMVQETRRIIFSKQHQPTDYLLNDFEGYADDAAVRAVWTAGANTTLTLNTSISKFGSKSMRAVASGGAGEIYRALPASTILIPRPYPDRLRHISFYVKINSGTDVIGVSLRDASNRLGLYRTWNVTVDSTTFGKKIVDLTSSSDASAGTWDTSLIDEIAFTNITSGKTIDVDHIDLATTEFDFLQYQGYQEDTTTFNYFSATMTADFRNVGEPVDVLV